MPEIVSVVIGFVVVILFYSLFGAVLLRAAVHIAGDASVGFGNAFMTNVLSWFLTAGVAVGLAVALTGAGITGPQHFKAIVLLLIPVSFLSQAGVISNRLSLSFGKSCFVTFLMGAIGVGLGICIQLVVLLIRTVLGI